MRKSLSSIRHQLGIRAFRLSPDSKLRTVLVATNHILFRWDKREHLTHPGHEKPEQTYYVIRPRGTCEGLLSLYYTVLEHIYAAKQRGWSPFVDFEHYPCQYTSGQDIRGTKNAWEYYFLQPAHIGGGGVQFLHRKLPAHKT